MLMPGTQDGPRKRAGLPAGTVTFLFTDIQGSTSLLNELGVEGYASALADHRRVIREACSVNGGVEVDTQGDAFFFAFPTAPGAVAAASEFTARLATTGPIRVRVGVHTGTPLVGEDGYIGPDVHRAARIAAAGHGGQVLLSAATARLVGAQLTDLGEHRFKGLAAPERVYQLGPDAFPPLKSLYRVNLPIPATPLLGRERELQTITDLITRGGARLVTLTGPGGTGKTRLAIQAAAELVEEFADGVFFVPLAALRETAGVGAAVAEAVGLEADDDVVGWLASRRMLVVLDNLEQLPGVASVIAPMLTGRTVVLATSRSPLRLSAEHELPVSPLDDDAAVELFVSRAARAGRRVDIDPTVRAICRRLDNLPLAIELAAARRKLLAPAVMLQRIDSMLSGLGGAIADLPERQRTLRATIAWSYELLDEAAQVAFRGLSVFRGSFALEDAEAIAETTLDLIGNLLDQSLVVARPDGRFQMLETIRAFGHEQLEAAGETREAALRHARFFLRQLEPRDPLFRTDRRVAELRAWYEAEEENLRTMLDRLTEHAPGEAARAAYLLHRYLMRWGSKQEDRRRLIGLAADERLKDSERALVLVRLAALEDRLGDWPSATEAAREAAALTADGLDPAVHVDALGLLTVCASRAGDHEAAVRYGREGVAEAEQLDRSVYLQARYDLAGALALAGGIDEARAIFRDVVAEGHAIGDVAVEMFAGYNLAELELRAGDFEAADETFDQVVRTNDAFGGDTFVEVWARVGRGIALACLNRRADARAVVADALGCVLASAEPSSRDVGEVVGVLALAADPADAARAATLRGAASALATPSSRQLGEHIDRQEGRLEAPLIATTGVAAWSEAVETGRAMSLDEAIDLARTLAAAPETTASA